MGSSTPPVMYYRRTNGEAVVRSTLWLIIATLTFFLIQLMPCASREGQPTDSFAPQSQPSFIHAHGRVLRQGEREVQLRAVNFSNFYFMKMTSKELLSSPHHSDADFARVKAMGFNSIRFAFCGDWVRDFPDDFWVWLDRNVESARRHGVYLILDLHVPAGSFWLDPTKKDVDFSLWLNETVREKNIEIWRSIALRYKDEPFIAAYDILNEPVTLDGTGDQWRSFAQELVDEIRSVDKNHLLIVGALYGVEGRYGLKNIDRHFLVNDRNVMYDFHFYEPLRFTHQKAGWMERPVSEGGRYPDPEIILPAGPKVLLPNSRIVSGRIALGDTTWSRYDSGLITVREPSVAAGMPMAVVRGKFQGTIHFDNITVMEYDSSGRFLRNIVSDSLGNESSLHWYHWQQDPLSEVLFSRNISSGLTDSSSLSIVGYGKNAVSGWSNHDNLFKASAGRMYRIVGYMRGEDVTYLEEGSSVSLEIDFYKNEDQVGSRAFIERGKEFLLHTMQSSLAFGRHNQVPMSVMEFGLVSENFEEDRGGERWLADVLELFQANVAGFAYWEYHGDRMGIFLRAPGDFNYASLPERPNQALIGVFTGDPNRMGPGNPRSENGSSRATEDPTGLPTRLD